MGVQCGESPLVGGIFERMVKMIKQCLRKTIGQAKLSYDELLTTVIEAELIINSRPLSYLTVDDMEEPLTPAHLLVGRRLLSLPDHLCYTREEEGETKVDRECLTKRMKYLSHTMDRFWKRSIWLS